MLVNKLEFPETLSWLKKLEKRQNGIEKLLAGVAEVAIERLKVNTPKDSGLTAESWSYRIAKTETGYSIEFHNSNVVHGYNVAVLVQYGHGTKSGTYVQGIDYINPALAQIFTDFADKALKEVTNA